MVALGGSTRWHTCHVRRMRTCMRRGHTRRFPTTLFAEVLTYSLTYVKRTYVLAYLLINLLANSLTFLPTYFSLLT